jgi:uncharacterized phiE125 gp8 family phage protein
MGYFPGHPYYGGSYEGGLPRKLGALVTRELPNDGNRFWEVITQPLIEPVTVDEVKTFARIDTTEEDTLIEKFIETVRRSTESYLGRALIQQVIRIIMDFWPGNVVKLPRPPLISVNKVVTLDEEGGETLYSADNYYLMTTATPGKLVIKRGVTSPINTTRDYGGFLIESKHGYGTVPSDVPSSIRDGIKLWVATLYADRTIDSKNPPPEARKFFDSYRVASRTMIR